MQDAEAIVTNVVIVTVVLIVIVTLLLLVLAVSPPAFQGRARAKIVQCTDALIEFLDRGAYVYAVFMVLSLAAGLVVAAIYLVSALR